MRLFRFLIALLLISGCAHQGIKGESVRLVDKSITYSALKKNPDLYVGKYVYFGGAIAHVRNTSEGSELEVVEMKLDSSGKPENNVNSEGRYLARSEKFLDPFIFYAGQFVSLVGEVKGQKTAPLNNMEYRYPVIAIHELHLWKPEDYQDSSPTFHFGFGVFKGF